MLNLKSVYNTSEDDVDLEFFLPCLEWAKKFDRGVGYFTSGWIKKNIEGIYEFLKNGEKIRWIISPILTKEDSDFFYKFNENTDRYKYISNKINENYDYIRNELSSDTLNLLGWLLYDDIIEIKFAVTKNELSGNFHDKFGIFYNDVYEIGFSGSNNDTINGFNNYESFKVYKSWDGELAQEFLKEDKRRFNKLWSGADKNIEVFDVPTAVKDKIIKGKKSDRPYEKKISNKWIHQDEAVKAFLDKGNGIISMATGTGKTRTAIKILMDLFQKNYITKAIITVSGNDLLDQWYKQLINCFNDILVFRSYKCLKETNVFIGYRERGILLISRESLGKNICKFTDDFKSKSIIICDEVHGLGSDSLKEKLFNKLVKFKYRLGLSATPKREYDEYGNELILNEIGNIIYEFPIEKAIERGILCRLKYHPLEYLLTESEKKSRIQLIKKIKSIKNSNNEADLESLLIRLANVKKTAENKVGIFKTFIQNNQNLLEKCIIFVKTKEYGERLQEIISVIDDNYKTYYGEDSYKDLDAFTRGDINYLITSQKISEGVDIKSVENIVLFYSDKALSQTIQRIGRALRIDPNNPDKYANIVDFYDGEIDIDDDENSDLVRMKWLKELEKIGW